MKTVKLLTIILAVSITSCSFGQYRQKVSGSGKVVTKDRKAEYFNSIKVSSGIDVYLMQGNTESIKLEADDNLHEYILTEISGGTLKIYTEVNIQRAKAKKVYVTMKDVESLSASSAGDIYGKNIIKTKELNLNVSSAGDIKLNIVVEKLSCSISSAGDITVEGTADELEADLSSAGDLNAYELTSKIANVSTSSAGNAKIMVTEKLTARTSSAGDIYFQGNPSQVDGRSSSAGGIHKR